MSNVMRHLMEWISGIWERLSPGQQRFVRFAVVGASGVVVNFTFFTLGLWLFAGLGDDAGKVLASAFGIAVSVVSNFILNNAWTWGDRTKGDARRDVALRFGAFVVAQSLGAALQFGIFVLVSTVLEWNVYIAQGLGIGVGTIVNYVINNKLVFKDRP